MATMLTKLPALRVNNLGFRQWVVLTCAVALTSGYTTAFLYHMTETQRLPFRPVLWLAVLGGPLMISAGISFPRLTGSQIFLLVFLIYRWVDAVVFGANRELADSNPTKDLGGAVVWSCCCLGILSEPRTLRRTVGAIAGITIVAVLLQIGYEVLNPGVFSHLSGNVPGRAGGWFGNANSPPLLLCEMLGLVLVLVGRSSIGVIAIVCVGIGILPTFSRGGAICYVIMVFLYLAYRLRVSPINAVAVALSFGLLGGLFETIMSSNLLGEFGGDQTRRAFLQGRLTEGVEGGDSRFELAERAWSAILRQPITGYGAGTAIGIFEPHNQVLAVWLDNGIIGVFIYVGALIALLWHLFHKHFLLVVAATPLWAYIPFSTSLLEEKGAILLMLVLPALCPKRERAAPRLREVPRSIRRDDRNGLEASGGELSTSGTGERSSVVPGSTTVR